ncbi:MAG: hypothetical protein ABR915_19415 [Thermoguttaceae bacterium]|jgi:hypothetical protein
MRLRRTLDWDPKREDFVGEAEASSLLGREQREPYTIDARRGEGSLIARGDMMEFLGAFCVVALALPLFCLAWAGAVAFIRPKHRWLWVAASVPVFFVVLFCWVGAADYYASLPAVVFRVAFGLDPTPDVEILHSSRELANKWDGAYLEFYADQTTIDRILQNGLVPISGGGHVWYRRPPAWWTPRTGPGIKAYSTHPDDPELRGEFDGFTPHDILLYDPANRKAFYHYWTWGEHEVEQKRVSELFPRQDASVASCHVVGWSRKTVLTRFSPGSEGASVPGSSSIQPMTRCFSSRGTTLRTL